MNMHPFISILFLFLILFQRLPGEKKESQDIVTSIKKIILPEFPYAHNPSLVDTDEGLLLSFRYVPDLLAPWISYIGVVFLNEDFEPISKPQLLNTRVGNPLIPSQSEDARLISYQGNLYVLYNDNHTLVNPTFEHRRDMYIARLFYQDQQFTLSEPLKLYHHEKYYSQKWQKNWVPFVWDDALLLSYSLRPHEVLYPDLTSGRSIPFVISEFGNQKWEWKWGQLRGGTPALLVDDEYLAFFHSSIVTSSTASKGKAIHHYYMGAYTFSHEPPFHITQITSSPIIADGFYTSSNLPKQVIFPGGFIIRNGYYAVAYGKNDQEVWVAIINRKKLKKVLVPVGLLK
ncbi:MAG: hypothetical protein ACH350_03920 [Parachlamydiaceae bacterium]